MQLGRHPYRPAHLHYIIKADGFETLITHIFDPDDPYINSDAVFGVKESLLAEFRRTHDPERAKDLRIRWRLLGGRARFRARDRARLDGRRRLQRPVTARRQPTRKLERLVVDQHEHQLCRDEQGAEEPVTSAFGGHRLTSAPRLESFELSRVSPTAEERLFDSGSRDVAVSRYRIQINY